MRKLKKYDREFKLKAGIAYKSGTPKAYKRRKMKKCT